MNKIWYVSILDIFYCSWIELKSLTNLKTLDLSFNRIKSLRHFQGISKFNILCIINKIFKILYKQNLFGIVWDKWFTGEKVQPMMNLEVLYLDGNLLKNNDLTYLKGLSSLKSLSIGDNQLEGSIGIRGK